VRSVSCAVRDPQRGTAVRDTRPRRRLLLSVLEVCQLRHHQMSRAETLATVQQVQYVHAVYSTRISTDTARLIAVQSPSVRSSSHRLSAAVCQGLSGMRLKALRCEPSQ
jgi:hypothetical protein